MVAAFKVPRSTRTVADVGGMTYEIHEAEKIDEALCRALDAADPLAVWRDEFVLPEGVIYLDGNSLGALPKRASARVNAVVNEEWGQGLIRSWNEAGWIDASRRVGAKLARLLGVDADEVVVADSTSVNLFKLLVAATRLRPDRGVILTESSNFPTDIYVARGVARLNESVELKIAAKGQARYLARWNAQMGQLLAMIARCLNDAYFPAK